MNTKETCSLIGTSSETTPRLVGMEDLPPTLLTKAVFAAPQGAVHTRLRGAYTFRQARFQDLTSPQIVRFAPPVGLVVYLAHVCHTRRLYTPQDILAWNSDLSA